MTTHRWVMHFRVQAGGVFQDIGLGDASARDHFKQWFRNSDRPESLEKRYESQETRSHTG